ncbi:unnamed protein product (macronuclear) [Paramecium tetraurelia]|uniref:RNA-binding protein NOB1 n=1 Tax=Paramecium tetraurelia TaxID=5888 RepID=A0C862_PARTE|nr:uncharacterized protein GSPATT00036110001 [Paramecium tetraurelia]CAK66979.1 unnamed protein product [Paramecium tetraurelia]|eukprot:XP_001434376.1 hypothetical protein (macronuclear) [Paramecium tetraurelia strain d4-2]
MNKLILDANAFIKEINFQHLSEHYSFVTHEAILTEVRDERARQKLQNFTYPLTFLTPSEKMIKIVKQFATQTSDIASLSPIDIELIALACTLIEENGQKDKLKLEPLKPLEFNKIKNVYGSKNHQQVEEEEEEEEVQKEENEQVQNKQQQTQQKQQEPENHETQQKSEEQEIQETTQKNEDNDDDSDGWEEVVPKKKYYNNQSKQNASQKPKQEEKQVQDQEEESSEDENEEEWINNTNIHEKLNEIQINPQDNQGNLFGVALLTTDFAMQNVLLQMGVPVLSTEGYMIKSARRFILECHICKTLVRDSTRLFCTNCGNNSLLKVSCSLESDGTIILYRKKNFKVNLRGTQYSIPQNLTKKDAPFIFCQDQLMKSGIQQQLARQRKQEELRYKKVMKTYENGIGFEDIDYKHPQQKITVGYGKLNPNDVNDMRKIKRNKKH